MMSETSKHERDNLNDAVKEMMLQHESVGCLGTKCICKWKGRSDERVHN
jgi:hypothetical protein